MKVVLVLPGSGVRRSSPTSLAGAEHLGIGSIAAYLRSYGHHVQVLNFQVEGSLVCPSDLVAYTTDRILSYAPDVVGMSITGLTISQGLRVAAELKRRRPSIHMVWGSHQASSCASDILQHEPFIDTIVAGDGEIPMLKLLDVLAGNGELVDVPGLWYRDGSGKIVLSSSPFQVSLEDLPWPARDTLEQINAHGIAVSDARISSSRGCPFKCSFCVYPALTYMKKWRHREPDDLIEEMRFLKDRFGITHFWFSDDNFALPSRQGRSRIMELGAKLIEADLGVTYRVLLRADAVAGHEELLATLAQSGMTCVYMGIESGSPRRLGYLEKHTTPDVYRHAIEAIRRHRIGIQIGFIMFDPLTSWADLELDARFLHEIGEMYQYINYSQVLLAYPGVPLADVLAEKGLLPGDFGYASGYREYSYENKRIGEFGDLMYEANSPEWAFIDDFFRRLRMNDLPALYRTQSLEVAQQVNDDMDARFQQLNDAGFALFIDLLELAQGGQSARMRSMIDDHRRYSLGVLDQVRTQLRRYPDAVRTGMHCLGKVKESGYALALTEILDDRPACAA